MATKRNSKARTKRNSKTTTKASTKRANTKRASTKRKIKTEKPNPDFRAVLSVFGEVQSVFEGEKFLYITLKVWNEDEYYSGINISVDYDLLDEIECDIEEGDTIGVKALCSSFFDRDSQRVIPIFTAFEITTDEDEEDEDEDEDEED